ncbi:MAG: hypothetical protein F6K42_27380, partial [Leptolyngbya sp. SIO1D8]|nr:hypothetical protein [Leptolyngbya sp. SIO1D8]
SAVEPLELLYVTNGSLLTAERWWQAHRYYQHRQNLHYQSLHQPGIVHGLGVRCIPAPETVPSELRDHRWIEIQPGIAIDLVGNPLVVDKPTSFRITSTVIDEPVTVYVVLGYVDPKAKEWASIPAAVVKEEFRIDERTTPPGPEEVELCRIQLTSNAAPLQHADNVLDPGPQELDLRDRQWVRARSPQPVQVGLISRQPYSPLRNRLTALLQAVAGLYPALAGSTTVQKISLAPEDTTGGSRETANQAEDNLPEVTLLVMPYAEAIALTEAEIERLQTYIARGSTVLIEYGEDTPNLAHLQELYKVRTELQTAIDDLQGVPADTELGAMREALMTEQHACESVLEEQLLAIRHPIQQWSTLFSNSGETLLPPMDAMVANLTQQPFLFDELPRLPTGPINLMIWESIVLVVGSLSAAWTHQQFDHPLPRSTLRSAQELGINILYQASRRQQMVQAQNPTLTT